MDSNLRHKIQILAIRNNSDNETIINTVGFIYVEDKKQITFNHSLLRDYKKFNKIHHTWHEDGKVHMKDNTGKILFEHKKIPLSKFKGQTQFLFSAFDKDLLIHQDYNLCNDSAIFLIDIRKFRATLALSIHLCDYWNVNRAMKTFEDMPQHQSFVFWKSNPKIVIIAFENI
jgi:hypothetical protein